MRLSRVTLWNYRSYWTDDNDPTVPRSSDIALAQGVNYIVGPNNVGKSNLLRAIALALDPSRHVDLEIDRAAGKKWGPQVVLEFDVGPDPKGNIKKLRDEVDEFEHSIDGFQGPSLASTGKIRYSVQIHDTGREEKFMTHDWDKVGKGKGASNKRIRALERFHEVVRFVDIHSGEDLNALLNRGFKEILANALGDEHSKAMKAADTAREAYHQALGQVLRPVGKYIEDRLRLYVPGIREVDPQARLPPVRDALADAHFVIEDAVRTSLDQKGTGVRGAMLLLLMSFIADSSKSAIVFGIEEPEAFLHPDAHRQLGEGLERFTQRDDVSLLVSTHSPFLFKPEGKDLRNRIFVVRKDDEGRSIVEQDKKGKAREDLLGSRVWASVFDRAEEVPAKTKLIVVVEGYFDHAYMTLAAKQLGISLEGMHIVIGGSASNAAGQALMMAARHSPERSIAVVLDHDESGEQAFELLFNRFSWKKKAAEGLHVVTYEKWVPSSEIDVEAEDMFANATIEAFLAQPGHGDHYDAKVRRKSGVFHYGLTNLGKRAFLGWLQAQPVGVFEPWRAVLDHLRGLMASAPGK